MRAGPSNRPDCWQARAIRFLWCTTLTGQAPSGPIATPRKRTFQFGWERLATALTSPRNTLRLTRAVSGCSGSLGAYLALSVASVEPRVKAVVEFFGGIPEALHGFTRMPPVLILHGEQDRVVPVSEAIRLQQLLERSGSPYEMKLYPDAGHGFNGLQLLDAGQRTLKFLRKYL